MSCSLRERLARTLPAGVKFCVHHFSSLPTSIDALFVSPVGGPVDATELENHFLSVSVELESGLVQVFAIEVLIYTTTSLTTLFVSKADSTGYLHLLNVPPGSASPTRAIIAEFLAYVIERTQNCEHRLVLSLFARAQDQYLFPGSIENEKKHVLDDRALIKWWAKIIDRVLGNASTNTDSQGSLNVHSHFRPRAHIVVPGCDGHETRTFVPRGANSQPSSSWHIGDPLKTLGKPSGTPERCLIPRFPDDPKARFAIDLDDELPRQSDGDNEEDSAISFISDRWRSVRDLAQFWELMSFRQECSAGRLVGFLWAIWEPLGLVDKPHQLTLNDEFLPEVDVMTGKGASQQDDASSIAVDPKHEFTDKLTLLPGPGVLSPAEHNPEVAPEIQSPARSSETGNPIPDPPPVETVFPSCVPPPLVKVVPVDITLPPDAYARCLALLLTLDYCDLPTATASTKSFLDAVAKEGGKKTWGVTIVGTQEHRNTTEAAAPNSGEANSLAGLIRKRPKLEANALGAGLVRKKPKT